MISLSQTNDRSFGGRERNERTNALSTDYWTKRSATGEYDRKVVADPAPIVQPVLPLLYPYRVCQTTVDAGDDHRIEP